MPRKIFRVLVKSRIWILAVAGISLYYALVTWHFSLWWVLGAGVLSGVLFGKVFCRWMCPLGLMMEGLMSIIPGGKVRQMYQYHKVGCPIAWISGLLNRVSVYRIRLNESTCKNCGKCDRECYIVAMEPARFSLYKKDMERPGSSYTCSKCLGCVASCPNSSLTYKIRP